MRDGASPDGDVAHVKVLHVVRTFHVVVHHSFTGAAEGLDGVNFSLLGGRQTGQSLERRPPSA